MATTAVKSKSDSKTKSDTTSKSTGSDTKTKNDSTSKSPGSDTKTKNDSTSKSPGSDTKTKNDSTSKSNESDAKTKHDSTSKSTGSDAKTKHDSTSNIDSTIETIEQHLEKKSPSGVTTVINNWIKALGGNKDLKDIASDLEDLKEALSAKDGKKIVELMTSLGEKTTASAENAEGNDAKGVKKLGNFLTSAAKTISKLV